MLLDAWWPYSWLSVSIIFWINFFSSFSEKLGKMYPFGFIRFFWPGRLTVDVTLRRGARHASFVISEGGTSARATNSRKNVKLITANTITNSTGYAIESSVDTDGQKFLFGSPQGYTADTTNRLIHISSDQFKVFAGYEYNSASPENHDTADAVRDQYLEGLYENVRLVRA